MVSELVIVNPWKECLYTLIKCLLLGVYFCTCKDNEGIMVAHVNAFSACCMHTPFVSFLTHMHCIRSIFLLQNAHYYILELVT